MKEIIQIFTEKRFNLNDEIIGEQKVVYIKMNGTIYVIRHDYNTGTSSEEVTAALNAKIDAFEPDII